MWSKTIVGFFNSRITTSVALDLVRDRAWVELEVAIDSRYA